MTQDELRTQYLRLTICPTINDSYELLNIYANYFLLVVKNHQMEECTTQNESDAKLINQMMLTKGLHLMGIIKGIQYESKSGIQLNNIIDPTIVASLTRNVFETVGMFNLIYRNTGLNDDRLIIYNLWVIAGLNYRQKFNSAISTSENEAKFKAEKLEIDAYTKEITDTQLYKSLNAKNQGKIHTMIKEKDYRILFSNNDIRFLQWHELPAVMGFKPGLMDKIYTYFSLYSHPSNVAVFQFGELFKDADKAFLQMTNFNLKNVFILFSTFVADYIKTFPNALKTYESIDLLDQLVINGHNTTARGQGFSINDANKHLG